MAEITKRERFIRSIKRFVDGPREFSWKFTVKAPGISIKDIAKLASGRKRS